MPPGREVGLGPGHIVLDGDPDPLLQRGTAAPPHSVFDQCLLWPNSCPSLLLLSTCFKTQCRRRVHMSGIHIAIFCKQLKTET